MRELMDITGALADEGRVRVLAALRGGELCVCQLIELLDLAPSTVSKHLSILRQARLIEGRKDGRWMYYRLADEGAPTAVKGALAWVCEAVARDETAKSDTKRLKAICCVDPEDLCCQQREAGGAAGIGKEQGGPPRRVNSATEQQRNK